MTGDTGVGIKNETYKDTTQNFLPQDCLPTELGSHVMVSMTDFFRIFDHHAIYLGESLKLLSYLQDTFPRYLELAPKKSLSDITVEIYLQDYPKDHIVIENNGEGTQLNTWKRFLGAKNHGKIPYLITHDEKWTFRDVIKRGFSKLGDSEFDLLCKNCETFSNFCITGIENKTNQGEWATSLFGEERIKKFIDYLHKKEGDE